MHRPALLLLLLTAVLLAPTVRAQVRHCTAADGSLVYTDRKCEEIGASERIVSRTKLRKHWIASSILFTSLMVNPMLITIEQGGYFNVRSIVSEPGTIVTGGL